MKKTNTILDQIVAKKREYVVVQKGAVSLSQLQDNLTALQHISGPDFFEVLKSRQPPIKIIAEVKQASPSAGLLRDTFDLQEINDAYQAAESVVAISVITEQDFFKGSTDNLAFFAAHNVHHKPLLRKDFLFDEYQIIESKLLGAQAYLLIASLFEKDELEKLIGFGQSIGIEPLVEIHTKAELRMVTQTTARCIGVNARDLTTFTLKDSARALLDEIDDQYVRIAESGIGTAHELQQALMFADAALIGSHFMRAPDIQGAIQELTTVGVT